MPYKNGILSFEEFSIRPTLCTRHDVGLNYESYRVYHRSKRLPKRDDFFVLILAIFESSSIFGGSWGSIENWLEPKAKPPLGNLACQNR